MNWKTIIGCVLLLLFCQLAQGQKSKLSSTSRQGPQWMQQLEESAALSQKEPGKAIRLVEKVVEQARRSKNEQVLAKAYVVLAEINEGIQQYELAQGRRQKALKWYQSLGDRKQMLWQMYHLGRLYNLQKQSQLAANAFSIILKDAALPEDLKLLCQEGIADTQQNSNQLDEGLRVYDELENQYNQKNDARNLQRIQAKKANIYARQQNAPLANENFKNSLNNARLDPDPANMEELDKAKEAVIQNDPSQEIELRQDYIDVQSNLPAQSEEIVKEQLKIADAYADRGDIDNALLYVNKSKALVDESTEINNAGDVYLRSSELQSQKGDYVAALQDIKNYEKSQKQMKGAKQLEVDQLLAVLKGQRNIDVLEKDFELDDAEMRYSRDQLFTQRIIIGLLSLLLLGALLSIYFVYKNVKAKRQANQLLMLKSLRTQMNPHFIFNVLNSVNNFIAKNDERAANKYLSEFSVLMRRVLDDSQKDFIVLEEELDQIERYLKLEHTRFRDKFDYVIERSDAIDYGQFQIPPMLIQPFVENAVWHGMRYKDTKGKIALTVRQQEQVLLISITDNGIGRTRSKALKTANQKQYPSTALSNVHKRLELINKLYDKQYQLRISDLEEGAEDAGTRVELLIPMND